MAGATIKDLKEQIEEFKVTFQEAMAENSARQDSIQTTMETLVSSVSDLKKQLVCEHVDQSRSGSPDSMMEEKKDTPITNENKISLKDSESDSLPEGYYFLPSDKMLINVLKSKILNLQQNLLSDKYRTVNLYDYQPQELSELYEPGRERVWYFIVKKDKSKICDSLEWGMHRKVKNGFWRGLDYVDLPIKTNGHNGYKKFFVFHENGDEEYDDWGGMTDWVMQEYRIDDDPKLDGWTLCKMYKMYETRKKKRERESMNKRRTIARDGLFELDIFDEKNADFRLLELKPYHIFGDLEADFDCEDALSGYLRH